MLHKLKDDPATPVPMLPFHFGQTPSPQGTSAIPSETKIRWLEAYVDNTRRDMQTMIVGGSMHCNFLGAEFVSNAEQPASRTRRPLVLKAATREVLKEATPL